ncbi:MAG: hypothetical protein JSV50_20665 [Desulfobacteraceae bacterium]|nr:MAG: hypothetical protein JSV50_20665 [Desulfobacteraceae bacterium]
MCMQSTSVRPYQKWRWSGDEIVADPIIPAARKVPGTKKTHYDIDIREYLAMEGNAVVREKLREISLSLSEKDRERFLARKAGSFDFRARTILAFVSKLKYIGSKRKADEWFFPEETLANGGGDCEDLAFVIASLLVESGISPYCVRVALGHFIDHGRGEGENTWDHAWVVYFTEGGVWEILEPLALVKLKAKASPSKKGLAVPKEVLPVGEIEYVPFFVFNRHHLWRIRSGNRIAAGNFTDYIDGRFWTGFDPTFAAEAHNHILDEALKEMPPDERQHVKGTSLYLDVNVLAYDPRDHFDFAYIDESWQRVRENLEKKDLESFGRAAHTIADFYAHSMYAHFAAPPPSDVERIDLYNPAGESIPPAQLTYNFSGLDMPGSSMTPAEAAALWKGRLISGQWWRWYTTFPDELEEDADDLQKRRCLPDHDSLAVDGPEKKSHHRLYLDPEVHKRQFNLRRIAAIEHIRKEYEKWRSS